MRTPAKIELSIEIAASPEAVFQYFSDPAQYRRWMGEGSSIEPRGGGAITVAYGAGPTACGEILEWQPCRLIVFSWGHGVTGEERSRVTIMLEPTESGTIVRLRHEDLPEEQLPGTQSGWRYYLSQLSSINWADKMDGRLERVVDAYVAAWGDADPVRRSELIDECWSEGGVLQDKYTSVVGADPLCAHIDAVRPMMPGMNLQRSGPAHLCHGFARFAWKIAAPGGDTFATGVNFCELAPDGRFARMVGFWD